MASWLSTRANEVQSAMHAAVRPRFSAMPTWLIAGDQLTAANPSLKAPNLGGIGRGGRAGHPPGSLGPWADA